jgi:hypothetical protein
MDYSHGLVEESYSRRLDASVQRQEMPYGYDMSPPPADTHDYREKQYETRIQYHIKSKH